MTLSRRWHAVEVLVPPDRVELAIAVLWSRPLTGIEEGPDGSGLMVAFSEEPWDEEALREELSGPVGFANHDSESDGAARSGLADGAARSAGVPGSGPAAAGGAGNRSRQDSPESPAAPVRLRTFVVEEEDWLLKWKETWRPSLLGRALVAAPAWWADPLPGDRRVVRIDPGLAFGTGTHESTTLAWSLLEETLLADPPRLLVDVGTGTGLLALGAVALAPSLRVLGTEQDGGAVLSLAEDIRLNDAASRFLAVRATAVPVADGAADCAVANLTAAEHERVDAEMARIAAPGCRVVLSGFLAEQLDAAVARWESRGFRSEAVAADGEWRAVRLVRV